MRGRFHPRVRLRLAPFRVRTGFSLEPGRSGSSRPSGRWWRCIATVTRASQRAGSRQQARPAQSRTRQPKRLHPLAQRARRPPPTDPRPPAQSCRPRRRQRRRRRRRNPSDHRRDRTPHTRERPPLDRPRDPRASPPERHRTTSRSRRAPLTATPASAPEPLYRLPSSVALPTNRDARARGIETFGLRRACAHGRSW